MIAIIGLLGFIIITALVQWFVSVQVWQGSEIDELVGDDDPLKSGPVGLLPMLNGWNGR